MKKNEVKKYAHRLAAGLIRDNLAQGWPFDKIRSLGEEELRELQDLLIQLADAHAEKGGLDT